MQYHSFRKQQGNVLIHYNKYTPAIYTVKINKKIDDDERRTFISSGRKRLMQSEHDMMQSTKMKKCAKSQKIGCCFKFLKKTIKSLANYTLKFIKNF